MVVPTEVQFLPSDDVVRVSLPHTNTALLQFSKRKGRKIRTQACKRCKEHRCGRQLTEATKRAEHDNEQHDSVGGLQSAKNARTLCISVASSVKCHTVARNRSDVANKFLCFFFVSKASSFMQCKKRETKLKLARTDLKLCEFSQTYLAGRVSPFASAFQRSCLRQSR